mgnify:CR=1 FL=1
MLSSKPLFFILRPSCIMIRRFPYWIASFMLWVTIRAVSSRSFMISSVSSSTFLAVLGSRAAVCSSRRRSLGFSRVAIRSVSAWRCPPERRPTLLVIRVWSPSPSFVRASR